MAHLLTEAIESCLSQDFDAIEIIVLDDASTDNTLSLPILNNPKVKYFRSNSPSGTGGAFNKAIVKATGEIVVLLCADDVFTCPQVISDIAKEFLDHRIVHVSRYYHQFIDGDRSPVRAWRCSDIIELGNNPSGLAFRRSAIHGLGLSNKMFVEVSTLVSDVLKKGLARVLRYDTVAVRIHQSISRNKDYYLKRWTSSPVEEWSKVGGKSLANDFTSLIQIKNYFTLDAVIKESFNFVKLKPINIINPAFWFFSLLAILTPRTILLNIPHFYRVTWGRATTKAVCRQS